MISGLHPESYHCHKLELLALALFLHAHYTYTFITVTLKFDRSVYTMPYNYKVTMHACHNSTAWLHVQVRPTGGSIIIISRA